MFACVFFSKCSDASALLQHVKQRNRWAAEEEQKTSDTMPLLILLISVYNAWLFVALFLQTHWDFLYGASESG